VVLDKRNIQAVSAIEFDVGACRTSKYVVAYISHDCIGKGHLPAKSSRHFSCKRPFFGMAKSKRSFRLSTRSDIVDSAPKDDLVALSLPEIVLLEAEADAGVGGRRIVEDSICTEFELAIVIEMLLGSGGVNRRVR
jgi:hypothetical protein